MAWLQTDPSGNLHISFRFGGKKFKRSLKTKNAKKAETKLLRLEETILLVESGRIRLPSNVDIPTFLLSDGELNNQHSVCEIRLGELTEKFFDALPTDSLEPATVKMMRIHERHLFRKIGKQFVVKKLSFLDLQTYVNKRALDPGRRGKTVSATTIKKELTTFRAFWNWARKAGQIPDIPFPSDGLRYPKSDELPPFETFSAISEKTKRLDQESNQAKELWASVFLNRNELEELLQLVEKISRHKFIYPMFVLAAHTGARRSEILRAEVGDISNGFITLREKKKKKRRRTTRRVPISSKLDEVLSKWMRTRPKSQHLFCHTDDSACHSEVGDAITFDEANHHFEAALSKSKFQHIRGWHVFRHSFCSNCAAMGVDQRVINEWVGHQTPEMVRRYSHLFPSASKAALQSVFG